MEGKRVRLADVAKMAGVSTATVSLVLNDHPRISDATKERVLRICKETGYSMDPVARAFARKRSGAADSSYLGTLAILEGAGADGEAQTDSPLGLLDSAAGSGVFECWIQTGTFCG